MRVNILAWTYILFLKPTENVVVDSFKHCSQFFFKATPPYGMHSPQTLDLCQEVVKNPGMYYYATKYDCYKHIPWYSAYTISLGKSPRQKGWHTSPEVSKEYKICEAQNTKGKMKGKQVRYQATDNDYIGSGYERGHLNPAQYNTATTLAMYSTFTLTNAAPQVTSFNSPLWRDWETGLLTLAEEKCNFAKKNIFFLTGVIPGLDFIKINNENVINIPSFFWTAVCCDSSDAKDKNVGWSVAGVGKNIANSKAIMILPVWKMNEFLQKKMPGPLGKVELFKQTIIERIIDGKKTKVAISNCEFSKKKSLKIRKKLKQRMGS